MHVSIDQKLPKIVLGNEILNVPQTLVKSYNTMYHGSKSELTKQFPNIQSTKFQKMKSAVIIEMAPLIHAKCSQKAGMTCFSDLAIVLYYEIMRLGFDYNRINFVFDRCFDDSLKGTRKSRVTGTILMFDDDTDIPQDMIDNFLRNIKHKNNLNEFLSKKNNRPTSEH